MTIDQNAYFGQTDPTSAIGDWNRQRFVIQQEISKLNTSMPVQVIKVIPGGVGPVGFVSIKILVDQLSGDGMAISHDEIPNVPYMRLQGGTNAVIIDPQVGDIGIGCFCSRDISAVKNSRKSAPPGSWRQYSFSDCMYAGGILNGAPEQYIHFEDSGVTVHSPEKITAEAPDVLVSAQGVKIDGAVISIGDVEGIVRRLIDERLIAFYNSHTHTLAGAGVPTTQLTLADVATVITKAN